MKLKFIPLVLLIAGAGCSPILTKQVKDSQTDVLLRATAMDSKTVPLSPAKPIRGTSQHADALATEQLRMPVMRRSRSTYIGSSMVPVTSDDKLPSIFRQEFTYHSDDQKVGRTVTLSSVANRIYNTTRIAVRIQPDVASIAMSPTPVKAEASGATGADASAPTASHGRPLSLDIADLKYSGPLVGFLNHLVDRLGLAWEYRDNTVVIMRFVTEAHEVSAFIGTSKYSMSSGAASGGSTEGSQSSDNTLSVNEEGNNDAFASMEKAVTQMISNVPGSSLVRSDGSKKLIVKTSKEMQAQVRDYIAAENATMQKQALIQFDIYSVQVSDGDERGVNWNIVFNALSNVYGVSTNSPTSLTGTTAAQLGVSILRGESDTSKRMADTAVFFNMLRQNGTSVQHRTIPMVAMNGTWARKTRLNTESYISETTPGASSITGPGAPGIKTAKITTGDQYQILPQILNNNTVLLKFGISLSDLLSLTDVTSGLGANQQKIQTPKVSANNEQYSVKIRPGEVMAITGLTRLVSSGDQRTLAEETPVLFGGSQKMQTVREHFIIFVRPVIL